MDDFALGYLFHRFFYRIFDFFRHWYVGGSRVIAHTFISTLERIDRSLAVKITLQHFFEPLYKDYSMIGRILGVFFRSARILMGGVVYVVVTAFFAVVYLTWLMVPPALLFFSVWKL
jgi:hypothetical protein